MKEVFELFVFTFKLSSDWARQSYVRKILIIEIVTRIRIYLVILDLHCVTNCRHIYALPEVYPVSIEECSLIYNYSFTRK